LVSIVSFTFFAYYLFAQVLAVLQVRWFSTDPEVHIEREQMCCYLTRTTAATHRLITENLHETPTYGGWVEAKGPRYCPSIEDKVLLLIRSLSLLSGVLIKTFAWNKFTNDQ
jgi:hypothetical protein